MEDNELRPTREANQPRMLTMLVLAMTMMAMLAMRTILRDLVICVARGVRL